MIPTVVYLYPVLVSKMFQLLKKFLLKHFSTSILLNIKFWLKWCQSLVHPMKPTFMKQHQKHHFPFCRYSYIFLATVTF